MGYCVNSLPASCISINYANYANVSLQLVTIFSAPNYCGLFDNAAAVMSVAADLTCTFKILPVSKRN